MIVLGGKGDAGTLLKLRKARINSAIRNDRFMNLLNEGAIKSIEAREQRKDGGVSERMKKHDQLVHALAVLIDEDGPGSRRGKRACRYEEVRAYLI